MSDEEITPVETDAEGKPPPIAFAEFLESVPPTQVRDIQLIAVRTITSNNTVRYVLATPDIQIHCTNVACNGMRFYRFAGSQQPMIDDNMGLCFVTYRCSNCQKTEKIFSILALVNDKVQLSGRCYKIGELPVYGPPTPPRLISLIGPDRDAFLSGRRCENQGLGIGAFAYYRRVVENQKNRILDEIIRVSAKLGVPDSAMTTLANAKTEIQFKKAIESVKDALPQVLLINGQNPLTLLHAALSEGLHAQSDERCLEIAQAVRVVLAELSERLGQALKDEAELNDAVSRLSALKQDR
jgi:hypothetical protein